MKQGIPKSARDLLAKQRPAEEHPSADLLNGYVEQSLAAGEKTLVMNHLAVCEECREVVFLAAGVAEEESVSGVAAVPKAAVGIGSGKSTWMWWKWAAPALAAVVVAAAVLIGRDRTQPTILPESRRVAAVNSPAQSPTPEAEDGTRDLVVSASRDEKKAAPPAKKKSELENETYVKDTRERDKLDAAARRQEPSQTQTRYWAMQQSQMSRPHGAPGEVVIGGPLPSQPPQSTAAAATGGSHAQPSPAPAPPTSQTVEVTSAAPLVQADNADLSTNFAANTPNGGNDLTYNQKPAAALKSGIASSAESASSLNKIVAAHKPVPPSAQWRITADGHLERAFSGGDWTRVLPEQPVSFRVVSVIGSDVWAGGNDGVLFHSTDRGLTWNKVPLTANGQSERGAIVSVSFDSTLQGSVTTDGGVTWATSDGGQTWQKH